MPVNIHNVITVTPTVNQLTRAAYTAGRKFPFTYQGFMNREPSVILDNIFRGDLAKICFSDYLLTTDMTLNILDYDNFRNDNFQDPNGREWHLLINEQTRLEINSSAIPRNYNLQGCINQFDTKVTAGNINYPDQYITPLNHTYDVSVQIYYDTEISSSCPLLRNVTLNPDNLENDVFDTLNIMNRYVGCNVYLTSWISMRELQNYVNDIRNQAQRIWTFGQSNRAYWTCPISNCNPIIDIFEIL